MANEEMIFNFSKLVGEGQQPGNGLCQTKSSLSLQSFTYRPLSSPMICGVHCFPNIEKFLHDIDGLNCLHNLLFFPAPHKKFLIDDYLNLYTITDF